MKRAPITELKARLSEHLEVVKAIEEIPVADRGWPDHQSRHCHSTSGTGRDQKIPRARTGGFD